MSYQRLAAGSGRGTRSSRRAELQNVWKEGRNGQLDILRLFRLYSASDRELTVGENVVELVLDLEYGPENASASRLAESA